MTDLESDTTTTAHHVGALVGVLDRTLGLVLKRRLRRLLPCRLLPRSIR